MNRTIITPDDIDSAAALIYRLPNGHLPTRPLPTTPGRRAAAILATGRDALARVLMTRYGIKSYSVLTKAIRLGFGAEPNWNEINKQGAQALGIWEQAQ